MQAGEKAILAQKEQIRIRDKEILDLKNQVKLQSDQIAQLKKSEDAWYHNPFFLVGSGIIGTLLIIK